MHMLRILKYAGVNGALLPLNIGIAWALTEMGMHYLIATAIGALVHLTIAFFINRQWTFLKPELAAVPGLIRAAFVETVAICIMLAATYAGVELLALQFFWARVLGVVASGIWMYIGDSTFTFKTKPFR